MYGLHPNLNPCARQQFLGPQDLATINAKLAHYVVTAWALVTEWYMCKGQPVHVHLTKCYKRGLCHTPGLTFWLTVGWDTSCTTTLLIGTC